MLSDGLPALDGCWRAITLDLSGLGFGFRAQGLQLPEYLEPQSAKTLLVVHQRTTEPYNTKINTYSSALKPQILSLLLGSEGLASAV